MRTSRAPCEYFLAWCALLFVERRTLRIAAAISWARNSDSPRRFRVSCPHVCSAATTMKVASGVTRDTHGTGGRGNLVLDLYQLLKFARTRSPLSFSPR